MKGAARAAMTFLLAQIPYMPSAILRQGSPSTFDITPKGLRAF